MHDLMSIASVSKPPLSAKSFVSSASPVAGTCIQQWGDVPSRGLRVGWPRCDLMVYSYIVNDVLQVAAPTRRPLLPNSSLLGGPLSARQVELWLRQLHSISNWQAAPKRHQSDEEIVGLSPVPSG